MPPIFQIVSNKGLDDDQLDSIKQDITNALKDHCNEEVDDPCGVFYNLHEQLREITSTYNDTVRGRCYICLENFCNDEQLAKIESFTDRKNLARIDRCFHRFHLICLYRDWFMKRHVDKDEFGNPLPYKIKEKKFCPICRMEVTKSDV